MKYFIEVYDQYTYFTPFRKITNIKYVSVKETLYDFKLHVDELSFYSVDDNNFIKKEYSVFLTENLENELICKLSTIKKDKVFLNVVGQFLFKSSNTTSSAADFYYITDIESIFSNENSKSKLQILTPNNHDDSDKMELIIYTDDDVNNNQLKVIDTSKSIQKRFPDQVSLLAKQPEQIDEVYTTQSKTTDDYDGEESDWKRENFDALTDGQFGDYDDYDGEFNVDDHIGR